MQPLLAAERDELTGQRGRALPGPCDLLHAQAQGVVGRELLEDVLARAEHDHQQVVEVVGDPACEPADGLHLLRVPELRREARPLLLLALALADVAVEGRCADDLPRRVANR